ncbi:hypothetical protein DRQ29_04605 [bacterium]|nr:DUF5320 domain-containing protein [bacterium]RKZ26645.1 MAG: hypothetical protein DRQ29_04605 [bacterium]
MPWGNGTGPNGEGPRTGRGLGYCNGYDRPGYATQGGGGRWSGRGGMRYGNGGFGGGWRRRNMYYATGQPGWGRTNPAYPPYQSKEAEKDALLQASKDLKAELSEIENRIAELGKDSEK